MKKFYSIVLMATMLLIGTTASAVNVASWAQLTAEAAKQQGAEITLTKSFAMPTDGGTFDLNGAIIDCCYETTSVVTGEDSVGYNYLQASKAKTYTLKNATFKNNKGSSGAVYVTAAATVNLENFTTTACKYGVRLNKAGATLNVDEDSNITDASYGIYVSKAATINNEGTINSIYATANPTIINDGTISNGVYVKTGTITTTITNNGTFTQALNVEGAFNLVNNGTATITAGTFNGAVSFTGIEIKGGTFNGQLSGSDITIHGGTFNVAPAAGTTGTINPGEYGYVKFLEGVGSLEIAQGYNWRSYDKMIVRNDAGQVEVTHANGSTVTCLIEEAFANVADGDVITLVEDVISYGNLWLGTAEKNGAFKSVTLDLNGHTLYSAKNVTRTITLTHGALYIVNSVPGQGGIAHKRSNTGDDASEIIYIVGSPDVNAINPRNAAVNDLFVYLLIDEGVTLSADPESKGVNGITVMENSSPKGNKISDINYYTNTYGMQINPETPKQYSVAYGVRVDIKGTVDVTKYAGKINGNIRHPNEMIVEYPGVTDAQIGDTACSTFFHIFPTAVMHTANVVEATAVYSSGYGRWLIEGLCQGATGVYVKSGVVDLTDAIIESTWTGEASIETGKGSGVKAGGNAVVVESNDHYTGQQAIVIGGDTKISTEAEGGAAVVDIVDDTHDSKVESIVINGGSFTGDNAIVISSETASEQTTTVNGVTVVGDITVGGSTDPAAVADIMGSNTHTTEIENEDGSKTVIISAGTAPAAKTEWTNIAALAEGSNANWTGFTPGEIVDGEIVKLGELQIISGNATDGVQQLTIDSGAVLNVDRLIMNEYARIIVEAGGKLIVSGTQGINAPVAENIVLKASDVAQAVFLFHPSVTSNRHPNATVEFVSRSYRVNSQNLAWQRFGLPTHNALTGITAKFGNTDVATGFAVFNYTTEAWDNIGFINQPGQPDVDLSKLSNSFDYYQMLHNTPDKGTVVTMKGELVGNTSPALFVRGNFWNGFANSYMAPINGDALVELIPNTVQKAFYLYKIDDNDQAYWEPVTAAFIEDILPLQPFLIRNTLDEADVTVDYATAVYNPAMGISPNPAPARRSASNVTKAKLIVKGENSTDIVGVAESDEFSAEFDNGYDAVKYMNDGVNLYVNADEKMGIFATDNLDNTYVGIQTINGGTYTIEFANVCGAELTLIDLETGARVAMFEGNTYEFTADANTVNDYRFEIVKSAKLPTAIDNTEAVKSAKGIYTITGQYLGEMNVWNTLPAGVYVVNGEKRVK